MSKKTRKRKSKKALKTILGSKQFMKLFKEYIGLYDLKKKELKKTIKSALKKVKKKAAFDPEEVVISKLLKSTRGKKNKEFDPADFDDISSKKKDDDSTKVVK